ncbi:MAG: hypothetical protein AB9833_00150 [Bacteroidales bacterium]
MQYMLVMKEFVDVPVFDASLFVTIRKRLAEDDFNDMSESLLKLQIERHEKNQLHKAANEASSHSAACYFAKNVMKFLRGFLHVLTKLASFIQTWSCKIVEFGKRPTDGSFIQLFEKLNMIIQRTLNNSKP